MNKPVAWIWSEDGYDIGVCLEQDKQMGKEFEQYTFPLYTHSVKELTDEEIKERLDFLKEHGASERFLQVYEEAVKWTIGAILRKAQEK